ncbi:hypothetical protein VNO77_19339 [Canavalia gladiata]|uniref:Secreted protein n=1 Tax=Canavalia gladiata TaxID=3824 RepID=A0AAN9LN62_CANGL
MGMTFFLTWSDLFGIMGKCLLFLELPSANSEHKMHEASPMRTFNYRTGGINLIRAPSKWHMRLLAHYLAPLIMPNLHQTRMRMGSVDTMTPHAYVVTTLDL